MAAIFTPQSIPDVVLVEPQMRQDERGLFTEIYKSSEFQKAGIDFKVVQSNHSKSVKKVIRGLHYQLNPAAQAKLVRVLTGSIFDAAVDIRRGSPTYGKAVFCELRADDMQMLFIPAGFAHGFCTLEGGTQVEYFCSNLYSPEHERGILYNDPALAIPWPAGNLLISEKDKAYPLFEKAENNFTHAAKK